MKTEIALCFYESGQPYLLPSLCYISLAHSAEMLAVAISDAPCGIDTENTSAVRDAAKLAKRYLGQTECEMVLSSPTPSLVYLEYFCQMEALVKQKGDLLLTQAAPLLQNISPEEKQLYTIPTDAGTEVIFAIGQPPFFIQNISFSE